MTLPRWMRAVLVIAIPPALAAQQIRTTLNRGAEAGAPRRGAGEHPGVPSSRVASLDTLASLCPAAVRDTTIGFMEGLVTDVADGAPVSATRVVFEWDDFDVDMRTGRPTPEHRVASTTTDPNGAFAVCGLPVGERVLVQAQIATHPATGAVEVEIPGGGVLVRSLAVDTHRTGSASVNGSVRSAGSGTPLAGAQVHLFGAPERLTTRADGSFHLSGVPLGTQSIEVSAVGYRPRRYAVDVTANGLDQLSIDLSATGTLLDPVRTVATAPQRAAALNDEFDRRSERGTGQYLTAEAIANLHPARTTDLMRYARGFQLKADTVFSSRGELEVGGSNLCMPTLLINGTPAESMDEVMPEAIHGIELYPSPINVPLQYMARLKATSSACGMILIWTK